VGVRSWSFSISTENSGLGICAISAHGLRLSQVTLYLGVYNRRMDGENVHKVYEKRKKSERSEREERVYEEE
jgi:hypothetical protein